MPTSTFKDKLYLPYQLFFKIPHKTLKFQYKLPPWQTKKYIGKHDRMEVFSTDIHWKKSCLSTMYKLCFCSQKECRKCNFRQSEDLNFKYFSFAVHPGDTSWRQWTKKTVKRLNDKSAWIKAWLPGNIRETEVCSCFQVV